MIQNFKIRSVSWILYIITIFVVAISTALIFLRLVKLPDSSLSLVAVLILDIVATIIIANFFCVAIIEVTITEKEFQVEWIRNIAFQNKIKTSFSWNEIYNYTFLPDRHWDLIKLNLNSGKVFRIWHKNGSFMKDDFYSLVAYLDKKFLI